MALAHVRRGSGPPLVLIHGIGSQWQMWQPVLDRVAREREVVALDLPGFGDSDELAGAADRRGAGRRGGGVPRRDRAGAARTRRATRWAAASRSRWPARATARSACVLSPAGFGNMREGATRARVLSSLAASRRAARPARGAACATARRGARSRSGHLVARPWRIPPDEAAGALRNLARSPGFEATLEAIEDHRSAGRTPSCPVTVAWGEKDRLLLYSRQSAARAAAAARRAPRHAHRLRPRPDLGRPGAGRAGAARGSAAG